MSLELERSRSSVEEKFLQLCTTVVEENGLKVYDLDYLPGPSSLRLFIMNPETKTAVLEDCIKVDKALTPYIDEESWMPKELTLEVSSPGLFRDLRQRWHFELSLGERIQLALKKFLGEEDESLQSALPKKIWKSKKVIGLLKEVSDERLKVEIEGAEVDIPFENVKKVNLEPNI